MSPTFTRLRGLLRKEILQVVRDPSSLLIAFLLPVVLLAVNGYGVSLDARHMRLAVVMQAPALPLAIFSASAFSRSFVPYTRPVWRSTAR